MLPVSPLVADDDRGSSKEQTRLFFSLFFSDTEDKWSAAFTGLGSEAGAGFLRGLFQFPHPFFFREGLGSAVKNQSPATKQHSE